MPVINEFVANHTGSDTNEYAEIWGDANTDYSNYWIVEIEGDSTSSTGAVDDFTFNVGKTDYNFAEAGGGIYSKITRANNKTPWRECSQGRNFFGQIQLKGGKTNTKKWPQTKKTDPSTVTVPADYPQNALYREVVAQHERCSWAPKRMALAPSIIDERQAEQTGNGTNARANHTPFAAILSIR